MHTLSDPFQQNSVTHCLELEIKFAYLQNFIEFLETLSDTIVYFEAEDTKDIDSKPEDLWKIQVYLYQLPDLEMVQQKINEIAKNLNISEPEFTINKTPEKDWVSEVQKTFVPIETGEFFIHDSNYLEMKPEKKIAIQINAGMAFGTGEHNTTSNCLQALSSLKNHRYTNCLDMGCGSGILAIAMAKLWPNQITAVDIDPQAVKVALENIHLNKVSFISIDQSNGYQSELVRKNAPYQIITANILANPLIEMAKDTYNHLQNQGIIILAGFLNNQMDKVIEVYKANNFTLLETISSGEWPAVIMQKS
jgi:ribosomal protein L11 methyltransferase